MLSIETYRNLDQVVLGTFLFAHSFHAGLQSRHKWSDQGPSNGAVIFYDVGFSAKLRSYRFVTSKKMLR